MPKRTPSDEITGSRDTRKQSSETHSALRKTETHPTPPGASQPDTAPLTDSETFGRYRIERQLGAGAMGAVYLAHDTQLDRPVALKTPSFSGTDSEDMVQRFYREARTAATLRHANICPVFDVGEINGVHFITMAFIDGRPLSEFIKPDKAIPERAAATTVRKLAMGLHHAHEAGIIHRDLKPANIMIDRQQEPIIMDFGIARKLGSSKESRITQQGIVLGTPAYMSPEQAEGAEDLGPASDQYSLGVIFFELLTGQLPADGNISAILAQKLTKSAPPPSTLRPDLDPRLDAICRRMTSRKIEDRYETLKDVADELKRTLLDKEETKSPPARKKRPHRKSPAAKGQPSKKTAPLPSTKRKRTGSRTRSARKTGGWWGGLSTGGKSAVAGGVLGVIGLLAFGAYLVFRNSADVSQPNDDGRKNPELAKNEPSKSPSKPIRKSVVSQPKKTEQPVSKTKVVRPPLKTKSPRNKDKQPVRQQPPAGPVVEAVRKDLPENAQFLFPGHKSAVTAVAVSPDNRRVLVVSESSFIEWDRETGKMLDRWKGTSARSVVYSPDGRWIVSGGEGKDLTVWDAETKAVIRRYRGHTDRVTCVAVSFDSRRIVSGCIDGTAIVWNAENGRKMHIVARTAGAIHSVDFSPDGRYVAVASSTDGKHASIWHTETGELFQTFEDIQGNTNSIAYSPDGRTIAIGTSGGTQIREVSTKKLLRTMNDLRGAPTDVEFSADGRLLAAASGDGVIWEAQSGKLLQRLPLPRRGARSITFAPDGRHVVTGSTYNTGILWNVKRDDGTPLPKKTGKETPSAKTADPSERITLRGHTKELRSVSFSPDGRFVLTASEDKRTKLWDAKTGELKQTYTVACRRDAAMSPDGSLIAGTTYKGTVAIWGVTSGKPIHFLRGHSREATAVAFSPDGRYLLTAGSDATAKLWDVKSGAPLQTLKGHMFWVYSVDFSPDGRRAVTASSDKTAIIWNVETGKIVRALGKHPSTVHTAFFTADGQRVVTSSNGTIFVWSVDTGKIVRSWRAHMSGLGKIAVSPDGRLVASVSGSTTKSCQIWDLKTGLLIQTLRGHSVDVNCVAFSPDSRRVVTGSSDKTAIIWNIKKPAPAPPPRPVTGRLLQTLRGHTGRVRSAVVSADGTRFVTGSEDGSIWIWDAKTGKSIKVLRHAGPVVEVAISPDGRRIASCSKDKTACLWNVETGEKLFTWRDGKFDINAVAYSPDGDRVVTVTSKVAVQEGAMLWNTETGLKIHDFWAQNRLTCATYAPNGLYIVTGEEILVVMWSIYSKSLRQEFRQHSSDVLAVAVSPDSARFVSGSRDKTAIVWNASTGEVLHTLKGHTGAVNAVAFSPDGHTIVTASREDKTVKVWHSATGKLLGEIGDKTTSVNSIAFLPDTNRILLGCDNNTATVWSIQKATAKANE